MQIVLSSKRNDRCLCLSGKKYKKCCLDKHNTMSDFEGITITAKKIPIQLYQDGRTELPDECTALFDKIDSFSFDMTKEEEEELANILEDLKEMKKKYGLDPVIFFNIHTVYILLGDIEFADIYLDILNKKFPLFLYGQMKNAAKIIGSDNPSEIFTLFNKNIHSLKDLDLKRTVFELGEAIMFHKMLIHRALIVADQENVERHLNNLIHIKTTVPGTCYYQDFVAQMRDVINEWTTVIAPCDTEEDDREDLSHTNLKITKHSQSEL